MIRKDKINIEKNSSDCIQKQSGEFTHRDALTYIEELERVVINAFNLEKTEDDKQTLA